MTCLVRSRPSPVLGPVALLSVLCSGLPAQAPATTSFPREAASSAVVAAPARQGDRYAQPLPQGLQRRALGASGAALVEQDGTLWGIGDRYKTRFTAQGFEFIPQLGPRAPHNFPLEFRLQSVGRGADQHAVELAAPRHEGLQVVYARGGFAERYDVKPEGIEQSFVFDRLPAGSGDLIVRGDLATDLVATPDGHGYRFELPGVGGLHFGGVTGIDAAGNRVAGRVAIVGGVVELSLPASFVDGAVLPLVLDPLVGSVFNAFTTDLDDRDPDVAYDVTNDVFLVVFERIFSATDTDIHGQRVSGAGALVGGRVFIENATTNEFDPKVANINLRDRFVVVYVRAGDIKGRFVNAATAAVLPEFDVAVGTDNQTSPDIGGEATTSDDDAICVWWNTTQNRIEACQIAVNSDDSVLVWDLTTIYQSATVTPGYPRISKSGGSTGNHCIVFERTFSSTDRDPAMSIVSRELTFLDTLRSLTGATTDQRFPSVDGDGRHWVVAWQQAEAAYPGKWDIDCCAVSWNPAAGGTVQGRLDTGVVSVTADANDDEYTASVIWVGGSVLVGWTDQDGTAYNSYFRSLDPFTCLACEAGQLWLSGSQAWDYWFKGCSKASGGGSEREALLVIESNTGVSPTTSNIEAQQWRSDDGIRTSLGGGCGADAGDIYATCARTGNADFRVRLLSDLASAAAVLVVSRDRINLPCGSCRLVPDPYTGFVVFATTNAFGQAEYATAIPNSAGIAGIVFHAQWLVAEPISPGCSLFGSDMTRAISLTIN